MPKRSARLRRTADLADDSLAVRAALSHLAQSFDPWLTYKQNLRFISQVISLKVQLFPAIIPANGVWLVIAISGLTKIFELRRILCI